MFMLAGTILNIILMLAFFLLFLFGANMIITPESGPTFKMLAFLLVIVLSVTAAFFIYSRVVKWITRKWDLEKYIHPLFGKGGKLH